MVGVGLGVSDGMPMVGSIWLRCSWQPMAFGSLEVLTKWIFQQLPKFGVQARCGQVLYALRQGCLYVIEVPVYNHLPGQGGCPALSTLHATQQSWKTIWTICKKGKEDTV